MEPSRELDRRVAELLDGWKPGVTCDGEVDAQPCGAPGWRCLSCGAEGDWGEGPHEKAPPHYSSRDGDAMKGLRKLAEAGYHVTMHAFGAGDSQVFHLSAFKRLNFGVIIVRFGRAYERTFPLAFSVAAVRAHSNAPDFSEFIRTVGVVGPAGGRSFWNVDPGYFDRLAVGREPVEHFTFDLHLGPEVAAVFEAGQEVRVSGLDCTVVAYEQGRDGARVTAREEEFRLL